MTARSRKHDGNSVIRNHAVAKEPRKTFRGGPKNQGCNAFASNHSSKPALKKLALVACSSICPNGLKIFSPYVNTILDARSCVSTVQPIWTNCKSSLRFTVLIHDFLTAHSLRPEFFPVTRHLSPKKLRVTYYKKTNRIYMNKKSQRACLWLLVCFWVEML
jgi:hypothetical protein